MQLLESCLPLLRKEMARLTEQEQWDGQRGGADGAAGSGQGSEGSNAAKCVFVF
jgi:hypothetical protein